MAGSPDLSSILNTLTAYTPQWQPVVETRPPEAHAPNPKPEWQAPAQNPAPLAASIKTYPAALRYITTHLLPSPAFQESVQHLIQTQHDHERQWYAGREKLQQQIRSRGESRARLDAVLAFVGGKTSQSELAGQDGMTEDEELRTYDAKIWKAQSDLVHDAEKELCRLGVPFFVLRPDDPDSSKKLELLDLRQRIVSFLQDVCGSE